MDALMVGTKCLKFQVHITFKGCRDSAVIRALASKRYGPGSTPRSGVICWLSLLVLYSAPRGFLRILGFPLLKNQHLTLLIVNFSLVSPVGHSRVPYSLSFKASLSAKFVMVISSNFHMNKN